MTMLSSDPHQPWYGNRFMFQSREYFPELGIYDYRHRMYHHSLGRFLQSDPTGFDAGDMNLFRYCGDDPVDRSDPTGLYRIGSGLSSEEKKQVEDAQKIAADKLEKGVAAIEYGVAAGKGETSRACFTSRSLLRTWLSMLKTRAK